MKCDISLLDPSLCLNNVMSTARMTGLKARFTINGNNQRSMQRPFQIPLDFEPITFNELKSRHTTQKGISRFDKSVQIVGLNADYKDHISPDGKIIKYMISAFDNKGNAWLDNSLAETIKVFLNLGSINRYYFCGMYRLTARESYYWTLTRL